MSAVSPPSAPRVVFALGVTYQLRAIEVHRPQITGGVPPRLVVEVWVAGMAALPAGGDRPGAHAVPELDDGHAAVAAGPVPALRPRIGPGAEGRQRTPPRGGEGYGGARPRIAERLDDIAGQALEAVDVTPGGLPGPEIGVQLVDRFGQRLEELIGGRAFHPAPDGLAPEHGERRRDRGRGPTQVPRAQQRDRLSELRLERMVRRGLIPRRDQRGERLLEPGEIGVERGAEQGVEREVLAVLQDPDRVAPPRRLAAGLDVARVVLALRARGPRRRPRPVVGVVEPAAGGIQEVRRLVDREDAVPLRRRAAAVHR